MNKLKIIFAGSICLLLLLSLEIMLASPHGVTYYVAKNGSDANAGTEDLPWLTFSKAAEVANAGDTVYVKEGTYHEKVDIANSGSKGREITFAAYPGNNVYIDGSTISQESYEGLINIIGKSYIIIKGFNFRNALAEGAGIRIDDNSSHVTLANNTFISRFGGSPIKIGWSRTDNITVEYNTIERYKSPTCRLWSDKCWVELISVSNSVDIIVRYNDLLFNQAGEGIDFKDGTKNGKIYRNKVENTSVGIYLDARGILRNFDIYANILDKNDGGIILATESDDEEYDGKAVIQDINIYNNLDYNNNMGIRIGPPYGVLAHIGLIKYILVINNIFFNNTDGNDIGLYGRDLIQNLTMRNNIFNKNDLTIYNGTIMADHNIVDDYRSCYGMNCLIGDPKFVDPGKDFHLQITSVAIDNGSPLNAPLMDFDDKMRPQGKGYDIGIYER